MKIEIKHRFNGSVLFSVVAKSIKAALEIAVSKGANLSRANLSRADLKAAECAEKPEQK